MKSYSNFEKLVFDEIDKIPYGKTKSYKEIAEAIGKPSHTELLLMHAERIQFLSLGPVIGSYVPTARLVDIPQWVEFNLSQCCLELSL